VNHLCGCHRGFASAGASFLAGNERALDLHGMAAGEAGPEETAVFSRRKVKPPDEGGRRRVLLQAHWRACSLRSLRWP